MDNFVISFSRCWRPSLHCANTQLYSLCTLSIHAQKTQLKHPLQRSATWELDLWPIQTIKLRAADLWLEDELLVPDQLLKTRRRNSDVPSGDASNYHELASSCLMANYRLWLLTLSVSATVNVTQDEKRNSCWNITAHKHGYSSEGQGCAGATEHPVCSEDISLNKIWHEFSCIPVGK